MKLIFAFIFACNSYISFGQIDDDTETKIFKHGKKYFLKNFKNKRFTIDYDSIKYDQNFYIAYIGKNVEVYHFENLKKFISGIRAFFPISLKKKVYQILKGNKIFWINNSSILLNENPKVTDLRKVCGTVDKFSIEIVSQGDSTFYKSSITPPDGRNIPHITKTNITKIVGKNKLKFLNNRSSIDFDENNSFYGNLNSNILIETTPNKKVNIIKLELVENRQPQKYLLYEQIDNIYINTMAYEVGYFAPFQFQKNNLFGYFPFTLKAKYLFLNPLNGNFIRFQLPSGKNGWLDKNGNEYPDN